MMAGDEVDVLGMIIAEDREGARAADVSVRSGVRYNLDEVLVSDEADFLVSGWVADADAPLRAIEVVGPGGRHVFTGEALRRRLRRDVAADLRDETGFHYGFWAYLGNAEPIAAAGEPVSIRLDMGETLSVEERLVVRSASEGHVRRQALVFAAIGTPHEEAIRGENRAAEWVRWLSSGPEIARFIAAFEGGYGKALSSARLANAVERKRRPAAMEAAAGHLAWSIDTVVVSEEGGLFVVGWLDDADDPVAALRITGPDWHASVVNRSLARIRREDVEAALQRGGRHPYGFWSFLFSGEPIRSGGGCQVELLSTGGRMQVLDVPALTAVSSPELRSIVLTYLANSRHFGAPQVEKVAQLSDGLGEQIVGFNRFISQSVIRAPHVERFVTASRRPKGSIVVCLYGKAGISVRAGGAVRGPARHRGLRIHLCLNSPELVETLLKEARNRAAHLRARPHARAPARQCRVRGGQQRGGPLARSDRILIVNPDVFPADRDWAAKHTALVESGRPGTTHASASPLYYDDGSLMHGGMYFELDTGLSVTTDGVVLA